MGGQRLHLVSKIGGRNTQVQILKAICGLEGHYVIHTLLSDLVHYRVTSQWVQQ